MLNYIILGIVQGLTEFLPVSSSGHLVILQRIFGMSGQEVAVSVVLHLGTLLALIVFFFKDILRFIRNGKNLALALIVTLATGVIGVVGKDFFESLFTSPRAVAVALAVTGALLLATRKFTKGIREELEPRDAFIFGITQGLSIIPGISRSGTTIATLLFRGIDRESAFKFSFIACIPVILGAALLEARKIDLSLQQHFSGLAAGFTCSFFSGLLALGLLKLALNRAGFHYFGYYCIAAAVLTFIFVR